MSAKLVEHTTKHSMNEYLSTLKKTTEYKRNIIFNLGIFIALVSIVGFMLYLKYKERNNVELAKKKEIEKPPLFAIFPISIIMIK